MNNEPVAYAWCKNGKMLSAMIGKYEPIKTDPYWLENGFDAIPLYTTPQIKELSDDGLNKAFDYYCETDEGVLRFNYELRDEWKKEQLIRWKEAFKKASPVNAK